MYCIFFAVISCQWRFQNGYWFEGHWSNKYTSAISRILCKDVSKYLEVSLSYVYHSNAVRHKFSKLSFTYIAKIYYKTELYYNKNVAVWPRAIDFGSRYCWFVSCLKNFFICPTNLPKQPWIQMVWESAFDFTNTLCV